MKKGKKFFTQLGKGLLVIFFLISFSVNYAQGGMYFSGDDMGMRVSTPYPFSDDFESGLGNWSVSGSDWAIIDTDSVSPLILLLIVRMEIISLMLTLQ